MKINANLTKKLRSRVLENTRKKKVDQIERKEKDKVKGILYMSNVCHPVYLAAYLII